MRKTLRVLFLGSLLGSGVELAAQELTAPPPVLRIFREDIKEGKGAAHEKSESAFMHAAARAKYPAHVLGTTAEPALARLGSSKITTHLHRLPRPTPLSKKATLALWMPRMASCARAAVPSLRFTGRI